jgi:DNA-binding CsgD family transcriptional regulator
MIAKADVVAEVEGRLMVCLEQYRAPIFACIRSAIQRRSQASRCLVMFVPPRRLPLSLMACSHGDANIAITLIISDPNGQLKASAPVLRGLYKLTPAEARVACALLSGTTLAEIAGSEGVSLHTVRTHLKHLFEKTGTGRQSQLLLVLLTSPALTDISGIQLFIDGHSA